jgi:hypothetical protein
MKIDDFLDKTLAANTKLTRKPKASNKTQAETAATQDVEKREKGTKANKASTKVDSYEPTEGHSMPKASRESLPSNDSPPVRQDRIARAKQLMASGAYNDQGVIEKIIDRLLDTIREA